MRVDDIPVEGKHVLSISGGKDSTAMYLHALETLGRDGFQAVFADTDNEHQYTVDYVGELAQKTGGPEITVVKSDFTHLFERRREYIRTKWPEDGVDSGIIEQALKLVRPTGNAFLDCCLLHGVFPSRLVRFCTEELKIWPQVDQMYRPIWEQGHTIINWQGIRAEESDTRSEMGPWQELLYPKSIFGRALPESAKTYAYRPLLDWSLSKVWLKHREHGIEPNKLYALGAKRVGCFPCIMVRKEELRLIGDKFDAEIQRIAKWEKLLAQVSRSKVPPTFIAAKGYLGKDFDPETLDSEKHGIRRAVEWARTTHGGRQYDLLPMKEQRDDLTMIDAGTACGEWGACE